MRYFIDTDIVIDVGLDRQPHSRLSGKLLDSILHGKGEGYIAWHTISNIYYILSSNKNESLIREFIDDLNSFLTVVKTGNADIKFALKLALKDFEDSLQVAAAVRCGADVIVTRNLKHYKASPIPVASPANAIEWIV